MGQIMAFPAQRPQIAHSDVEEFAILNVMNIQVQIEPILTNGAQTFLFYDPFDS